MVHDGLNPLAGRVLYDTLAAGDPGTAANIQWQTVSEDEAAMALRDGGATNVEDGTYHDGAAIES